MATYIKGVTDFIPALEPFKPDYKFLSDVLTVRQDRYDTNYKQLNDLYSKVVYAPLSRGDNSQKRDQYAKRLSNGLKQVSGLDLSLQQNADVAKGLFKPFFEDKALIKDMAATKIYGKENQIANGYLNSSDADQQRRYWETGVQGLQMWMEKYKNAGPEEALAMSMPRYVERPDLYNKAFESLKDSGLSIKQTTLDGDWIVTTQNGTALTRQIVGYKRDPQTKELLVDDKTGKNIPIYRNPAAEHLMNSVMQNPAIRRAYLLEAQVKEWNWLKENEKSYASVDEAKKQWALETIKKYADEETKKLVENEASLKKETIASRNWEEWKKQNNVIPGSAEEEVLALAAYNKSIARSNRDASKKRLMDWKGPKSDLSSLLSTAYSAYMAGTMSPKMNAAAVAYSQVDAEQTFEANPFIKQERQHQFDLNRMAIQHEYDMKKIYAKAEFDLALKEMELSGTLGNQNLLGINGVITERGDGNISGSLYGLDVNNDGKISDKEKSFVDAFDTNQGDWKIFNQQYAGNQLDFLETFTTEYPNDSKEIRGYKGNGQIDYTFYDDSNGGKGALKTGSLKDMVNDLSNMDNKYAKLNDTELDAVVKRFINAYQEQIELKDGSKLNYQIANQNNSKGKSYKLGLLYDNLIEGETVMSEAFEKQNEVYHNVYRRVNEQNTQTHNASKYQGLANSKPPIFLTQGEIDLLNQGLPWYKVKIASDKGKIEEPILDGQNKPVRRMLTREEYGQIYANMNTLSEKERQLLLQSTNRNTGTTGMPWTYNDAFPFFTRSEGTFDNTEYLASKYWDFNSQIESSSKGLSTQQSRQYLENKFGKDLYGTGSWRFDREEAMNDGYSYYDDFRNNMNAVMNSQTAPDVDLNFSVRSYMQGQPQLGMGETNYNIYTTTYDAAAKTQAALNQLKSLTNVFYEVPTQELKTSIGDNRHLTLEQQGDPSLNPAIAKNIVNAVLLDINNGFYDKTDKRPYVSTSYVEKSGGPDQGEETPIFSHKIVLGPEYSEDYKKYFGDMTKSENKALYSKFVSEGITISAPQQYDNNPYKSTNIMMSHVEREIRNNGVYNSQFIQNGGDFSIYQNSKGQYIQEYTTWGFKEDQNGNMRILPDATQTTYLNLDASQLDAHKLTLMEQLNTIANKNVDSKKTYTSKNKKKK